MNRFLLAICLLSVACSQVAAAQSPVYFTGLKLDDSTYQKSPSLAVGGKAINTAPQFSLKQYTPVPGNQGQCSSCVCWASSYTALTTSWAYKASITDKAAITRIAKSPMFVYVQITNTCNEGSNIENALKILKNQGSCAIADYNPKTYNGENWVNEIQTLKPIAYSYRIKDYATIYPLDADSAQKIDQTKLSLVNHQPVIAGFKMYPSFTTLNKERSLYHPDYANETAGSLHAMCVIGYNDFDQTLEVMNSWGTGWGNEGYFTIGYKDYVKLTVYGYQITMDDRALPNDPIKLAGNFELQKFTSYDDAIKQPIFEAVSPKLEKNEYVLNGEDYKTGDAYRLFAKNVSPNSYIYVFSIDPDDKAEVLYPFSKNSKYRKLYNLKADAAEVPRQYKNSIVEIPGLNKFIKTDVAGTDRMCILYAYNQIDDIAGVINKVRDSNKTTLLDKLKDVLGSRIMPEDALRYQPDKMAVSGLSNTGDIMPIILTVNVK